MVRETIDIFVCIDIDGLNQMHNNHRIYVPYQNMYFINNDIIRINVYDEN